MVHHTNQQIKIRITQMLSLFFKKITKDLRNKFLAEVQVQIVGEWPFNKYNINLFKDKIQSLVIIGRLDDLTNKALVGLIAHLYGLIYANYDKKPVPKGQAWLRADLYSDDIAVGWGFKEEVEELRKVRPQQIPSKVDYKLPILEHSVPDLKFAEDLNRVFDLISNDSFVSENRILYTGRFSLVCNIESLRKILIRNLYIITSDYAKNKEILNALVRDSKLNH